VPPTVLLVAVNRSEWRRNSRRRRYDPSGVISLGAGGLLVSDKEALEIGRSFVQHRAKPPPVLVRFGAGSALAYVLLHLKAFREIELMIEVGLDEVSEIGATHRTSRLSFHPAYSVQRIFVSDRPKHWRISRSLVRFRRVGPAIGRFRLRALRGNTPRVEHQHVDA